MSCLIHCKRCGSTDGTAFSGMCPECMHKELHEAFEADREEAAKHAAHATCETRQARTIRRLRALADGYRRKAKERRQPAYFCEGCGRYIAEADLLPSGVCVVHRTVPARGWQAVSVATGVAAQERARIVARLRALAGELRVEAETQGDTVFGTVAAVQEKTVEGLVSIIEKGEASK